MYSSNPLNIVLIGSKEDKQTFIEQCGGIDTNLNANHSLKHKLIPFKILDCIEAANLKTLGTLSKADAFIYLNATFKQKSEFEKLRNPHLCTAYNYESIDFKDALICLEKIAHPEEVDGNYNKKLIYFLCAQTYDKNSLLAQLPKEINYFICYLYSLADHRAIASFTPKKIVQVLPARLAYLRKNNNTTNINNLACTWKYAKEIELKKIQLNEKKAALKIAEENMIKENFLTKMSQNHCQDIEIILQKPETKIELEKIKNEFQEAIDTSYSNLQTLTIFYLNENEDRYPSKKYYFHCLNDILEEYPTKSKHECIIEFKEKLNTFDREMLFAHRTDAWKRYLYNCISILSIVPAIVRMGISYSNYGTLQFWKPKGQQAAEYAIENFSVLDFGKSN